MGSEMCIRDRSKNGGEKGVMERYSYLLSQPPPCFSLWSPSSFVVDDVSYSCAEQFMMAENTRLFQDHRPEELIMSSSDRARTSSLAEAWVTSTTWFGTAFAKTPFLLATLPSSHGTRP